DSPALDVHVAHHVQGHDIPVQLRVADGAQRLDDGVRVRHGYLTVMARAGPGTERIQETFSDVERSLNRCRLVLRQRGPAGRVSGSARRYSSHTSIGTGRG